MIVLKLENVHTRLIHKKFEWGTDLSASGGAWYAPAFNTW